MMHTKPFYEDDSFVGYHLEDDEDWAGLVKEFGSPHEEYHILKNAVQILKEQDCKTVLLEKDYVDLDYRNEFSNLYSKTFKKHGHFTDRLHFFQGTPDFETIKEGMTQYLGYLVLRPTAIGRVGRTVLSPPFSRQDKNVSLCRVNFASHIQGREFSINGSPFIQQDSMVMVCAQASLWMALRFNTQSQVYHSSNIFLPHDITENASKYSALWGRSLPSESLTVFQMINVLANMGYYPVRYIRRDERVWKPEEIIHRYLTSKIPVVVTVPGGKGVEQWEHALTVFGYLASSQVKVKNKFNLLGLCKNECKLLSLSQCIKALIVHDDQLGPYRLLPLNNQARTELLQSPQNHLLPPNGHPYQTVGDIRTIIVPLSEKIYLLSSHISKIMEQDFLNRLLGMHDIREKISQLRRVNALLQEVLDALESTSPKNPIFFGGFLFTSYRFQEYLKNHSTRQGLAASVGSQYQRMRFPHYIWVVDLSLASQVSESPERTIFGEVIFDSTANRFGPSFLSVHLPGVLITRNPHSESIFVTKMAEDDKPYKCYPDSMFDK